MSRNNGPSHTRSANGNRSDVAHDNMQNSRSNSPSPQSDSQKFSNLTQRLSSFANFPQNTSYNGLQLARIGYCYKNGNLVCVDCKFQEKPMVSDILVLHERFNPKCGTVKKHKEIWSSSNDFHFQESASSNDGMFASRLGNESESIAGKVNLNESKWRYEFERKNSFSINKIENFSILAKQGFYMPDRERIQCYACSFSMMTATWQTIFELHSVKSTGCPFTSGKAFNVPFELMSAPPQNEQLLKTISTPRKEQISTVAYPRVLDEKFFNRLLTFKDWHDIDTKGVSAINCAFAGFVFAKKHGKAVLECQECQVMMLNTLPSIDMMIEHASCSPACPFITRVKGIDFFKYAIEIRNIALKKAGKPSLNVKALDVTNALKEVSPYNSLNQEDLEWFARESTDIINLGFPHKVVHHVIWTLLEASRNNGEKPTSLEILKHVQNSYMKKYLVRSGSQDSSGSFGSDDWPPSLKPDENLGRCLQCLEKPISTQIVGCLHICLCSECATFSSKCPECSQPIRATNKLYVVETSNSTPAPTPAQIRADLYR